MSSLQIYCKSSEKSVKCEECEKHFHTACINLGKRNCWNKNQEMNLSIAPAAKLTVVYVAVLFYMVTKQSSVTNVKCGFAMNALSSQNLNLIL